MQLAIGWMGRSATTESKYIFCLRLFDERGTDITVSSTPPTGWSYSATSMAHCKFGMTNRVAGEWEEFRYTYLVPENASAMTISLRYWRDGDYHVDIDDVRIQASGIALGDPIRVAAPVVATAAGRFEQNDSVAGMDVRVRMTYTVQPEHILAEVEIEDTTSAPRDVPLRVVYTLPLAGTGWKWGDDVYASRELGIVGEYQTAFASIGRLVSYYPWSAVYGEGGGIALAVPMDIPRIQNFRFVTGKGLEWVVDLCLAPETEFVGRGKASATFLIYRFDPEWGFRAAAAKYYRIYPQFFEVRTRTHGAWQYPIPTTQIPNPEDFGFAFFETHPTAPEVVADERSHGVEVYFYVEPWGPWQALGYLAPTPPPAEERIAILEDWAETVTDRTWMRVPRHITARAVIQSSYRGADGGYLIDAHPYFWSFWGGVSNQLWPCYPDPGFPEGSMSVIYRDQHINFPSSSIDGSYIDSIAANASLSNLEDFERSHFRSARSPLTFSHRRARAVIAVPLAQYDLLDWLDDAKHSEGQKVMGNVFVSGYRYYAHLLDIVGSEVFGPSEGDAKASVRRALSYHKVNTNLLQWFREQAVTREEVEAFIKDQLFWGFFPGIATASGGIGFGQSLNRYFADPELYERDRDLFQRYVPIIRELSQAGWEPIPCARASTTAVRLERFGEWGRGAVLWTVKTEDGSPVSATVTADLSRLGVDSSSLVRAEELVFEEPVPLTVEPAEMVASFDVEMSTNDLWVVRLFQNPTSTMSTY